MAGKSRGALGRLLRLWRLYATLDLLFLTRDLKLMLTWYLSDALINIAAVTATLLLAERFAGIGGWTQWQVIFMLGYATLVSGILSTLFGYNVLFISRRVGRGQMDHSLVQPQPIWMALLTEGFTPFSGSAILLPGLALLLWAGAHLALPVGPAWLALFGLHLLASTLVALSFSFLWGSLAFWAPRAAEEISSSANSFMSNLKVFPLDGLAPALVGGLVTVLPVGLVAWYPCRVLLGIAGEPFAAALTPLAALVLAAVTALIFRQGMRYYGRTGSQRYSGFGHRS